MKNLEKKLFTVKSHIVTMDEKKNVTVTNSEHLVKTFTAIGARRQVFNTLSTQQVLDLVSLNVAS
jgi:hypothetical protein